MPFEGSGEKVGIETRLQGECLIESPAPILTPSSRLSWRSLALIGQLPRVQAYAVAVQQAQSCALVRREGFVLCSWSGPGHAALHVGQRDGRQG